MINFKNKIASYIAETINLDINQIESYIEVPKDGANGDYAFPCFKLAKELRKAPPAIANEIKENIKIDNDVIEEIDVAGGYLNFYINKELLQQAVLDYFTDIYRLKKFHGIDKVNITKILSYEVYWLLRRKPIQIKTNVEGDLKFVNENFLTVFLAHEFLFYDTEVATDAGEKIFFDYLKHISYHLKYRNVDKQNIEIMLLSFETGKELYRDSVRGVTQEAL